MSSSIGNFYNECADPPVAGAGGLPATTIMGACSPNFSPLDSIILASPDTVSPHELAVERHVSELVAEILADGNVRHPIIAAAAGSRYVLLDGTHRLAALQSIGVKRVPLQLFAPEDVDFASWAKTVVHRRGSGAVLDSPLGWRRGDDPTAAVRVLAHDGHAWHSNTGATTLKERARVLGTVLSSISDADEVRTSVPFHAKAGPDSFVLVFQPWSLEDVLELARQGLRLPSGLTRVIVSGRVLNLRVPLEMLGAEPLDSSAWTAFISAARRRARVYDEPTIQVD